MLSWVALVSLANLAKSGEVVLPQSQGSLLTRWAKDVNPALPLNEYPRPQLVRPAWVNLNGQWNYSITPKGAGQGSSQGKILVPFAIESTLSGVKKKVGPENELWYQRSLPIKPIQGKRWLLHFGAVDWESEVFVNGRSLSIHRGGYTPFSVDITDALKSAGENTLKLRVWDSTGDTIPRGKQLAKPEGIWYTSVTGIWQTVWLEPVPTQHIDSVSMTPNKDLKSVSISVKSGNPTATIDILEGQSVIASAKVKTGRVTTLEVPKPKLWTPVSPFLYSVNVRSGEDQVRSYFGMRTVGTGRDEKGVLRLLLNNKPIFHFGPLDQGWWPDGLYTAPTDAALKSDIQFTRALGFNMARKHVKVEPARWYYWADRLGLMVWQDMPSTFMPENADKADKDQFQEEWREIMDANRNSPSIVLWVVFNEGWGQHDTGPLTQWTKAYDPSRTVSNASGWTDRGVGDILDMHHYPDPASPPSQQDRVTVLGEYGGLGLPVEGHTWIQKGNWGYRSYNTIAELRAAFREQLPSLLSLRNQNLAAAVYTQTTDVEVEVNGLMTYDRQVVKVDPSVHDLIKAVIDGNTTPALRSLIKVYEPLVRNATTAKVIWRYTTDQPASGWEKPDHDDSTWKTGLGGFGTTSTPGAILGTEWTGKQIWLRRDFDLKSISPAMNLEIHHDEDAEVFVNGTRIANLSGFISSYERIALNSDQLKAFRIGHNVLAITCKQTSGGQFIDAGFVVLKK